MDARYSTIAALAAKQQSVVSLHQLDEAGVSSSLRHKWTQSDLLRRLGPRSYAVNGSEPTWIRNVTAAFFDLDGRGAIAGRSAARLLELDGFRGDAVELIVPRVHRRVRCSGTVRSTRFAIGATDVHRVGPLAVLRGERLILESPLFDFTKDETENAIDSAIRKRLVSEQRLRSRALDRHNQAINGSRVLLDALIDSGGESRLERSFLRLVREAGFARPILQQVFRDDGRTIARVDALFQGGLVVELAGHATHSSRRDRQRDAERHTELTLRGLRVITFTYEDVRDRPQWVVTKLREALRVGSSGSKNGKCPR